MRYFGDYCEACLNPATPPNKWVFRPNEIIQIEYGVSASCQPLNGEIWIEACSETGEQTKSWIAAKQQEVFSNGYIFYTLTLAALPESRAFCYHLGYRDKLGRRHKHEQRRLIFVDANAPRSIEDVKNNLLGVQGDRPVYGPNPLGSMSASPIDWQGRLFYSLILDRFANQPPSPFSQYSFVSFDLTSPSGSHGGNLAAARTKLTYLKQLGVGAIVLSPVYLNDLQGYHGYHPIHLMMVDPRLGTLAQLRDFVDQAHALDIAVILDVVNNHLPDLINWQTNGNRSTGEFKFFHDEDSILPYPSEARNSTLFHGPEFTDIINQRLFGFLEDWRTETDFVQELLVRHLKYWIAASDIDGLRYDAVRHVGLDFWTTCIEEIRSYTECLGKTNFLQIAEHAGSTPEELMAYTPAGFNSFLDYPTYYMLANSVQSQKPLHALADYFSGYLAPQGHYTAGWRNNLAFLDNHDRSRMFHYLLKAYQDFDHARSALHLSLFCLLLGPEIPMIYYGTEQEFCGALGDHYCDYASNWVGHDFYVREDMFENPDCRWKFGPVNRPAFAPYATDHITFQLIAKLADLRSSFTKLFSEGTRVSLTSGEDSRQIIIHRPTDSQMLLAALNTSTTAVEIKNVQVPEWYGEVACLRTLASAPESTIQLVNSRTTVRLPANGFALCQVITADQK